MDCLGDKKIPKIKKNTLIATYDMGGLKMPEISSINTVSKVKWIKKLLMEDKDKWKILTWYLLNIPKNKIKHKLPLSLCFKSLSPFHRQMFESWEQFYGVDPKNANEITDELIFNNKFICSGGEPLKMKKLRITDKKLEELTVGGMVSNIGEILTLEQFCPKYDTNIDALTYNKITSSIPGKWKKLLRISEFKIAKTNKFTQGLVLAIDLVYVFAYFRFYIFR